MSQAPPGYADPEHETHTSLGASAAFLVVTALSLAFALYDAGISIPRAYATSTPTWVIAAAALCSAALAAFIARRGRSPARGASVALAVASLVTSASGMGFTLACTHPRWLEPLCAALPLLVGASCGFAASACARAFAPGFAALDGVIYLVNPLRALLIAAASLLVLLALPWLGIVRRGALLGNLLAGAALLAPIIARWFELEVVLRRWQRGLLRAAPLVALGVLLTAQRVVPLADVQHRNGEVLCVLDSEREHHVFVRLQQGVLLFSGELLVSTSTDARRFAEALVHPALAAAAQRGRVLALDDGSSGVAREILRWPDVRALRFVPHDPELLELAKQHPWFRELGASAFEDPRVTLDAREAAVFLSSARERYDVIIANLRDPTSYLDGKYFTVAVLRLLAERLDSGGLLALQITSAERTPKTHALILRTLEAAGFCARAYRAPLATLGEWGFALAVPSGDHAGCARLDEPARFAAIPAGTSLVTSSTLPALFARLPREPQLAAKPSRLFEQPVVESYQREEHALGE